ncbi:MAG: 6-phosphofructokinase [Bacilli bacterium]
MKRLKGNVLYGQSGGPTSVINASGYGLFKEAFSNKDIVEHVYAMHFGIEGLLENDLIEVFNNKELEKLCYTPGAYFGSNRYKLEKTEKAKTDLARILEVFKKYNIRYFFYNGGNDSMSSCYEISNYLSKSGYECCCIGIPKTIDNDLLYCDHTPGYGSAAKYIANAIAEIYYDDHSYKNGRVNVVEVMGRNAGWLTASSKLAKLCGAEPDLIYVPEVAFDLDNFLKRVHSIYEKKHHCLVVISEGIKNSDNLNIFQESKRMDAFNHIQLGGVSNFLVEKIEHEFKYKTRAFELSLLQRANTMLISKVDLKEAIKVGKFAFQEAIKGKTNKMIIIKRISNNPYKIKLSTFSLEQIKNNERLLPLEYIDQKNKTINDSFIDYVYPLIQGEVNNRINNGLIQTIKLEK